MERQDSGEQCCIVYERLRCVIADITGGIAEERGVAVCTVKRDGNENRGWSDGCASREWLADQEEVRFPNG